MPLLKFSIGLIAITSAAVIAVKLMRPPDHLSQLRGHKVKETIEFDTTNSPKGIFRTDTLFLDATSPSVVKAVVVKQYPKSDGWVWRDYGDIGGAIRGMDTVVFGPSAVLTQGTSDAPENSTMVVMDSQFLTRGQVIWEQIAHRGKIPISRHLP